jgi:hypothetical protein
VSQSLIQPAAPSYTEEDFQSLRARLIALCNSVFPNLDLASLAELATLLLETNAWIGDVLTYYLNATGREARITTATQRRGLLGLVKLIGFRVPGAVAAQATEQFVFSPAPTGTLTLPAGTIVQTQAVTTPIQYQLLAPLVAGPSTMSATATVENSTSQEDQFTSTGAANQAFLLTQTPYIDASVQVTDSVTGPYDPIENPTGWHEVTNFLSSLSTDHVYTTTVDNLDRCLVTFGNGVTGALPGGTVTFNYKTGGGTAGAVTAGALNDIPGTFTDSLGNTIAVSVTNPAASTPGADRYSVAQIQQLAPASLATQGRAVSNSDFVTGALAVSGVLRALFLTSAEDPTIPWNTGMGFVVPTGGGQPTALLLQQVLAQFQQVVGYPAPSYPKLNAFPIQWLGVPYLTVNVSALVYLQTGAQPAVVGAAIRSALTAYFSPTLENGAPNPMVDFGYSIQDQNGNPTGAFAWGDLFDLVSTVTGVLKLDPGLSGLLLNGARADVAIQNHQFPQLGSVQLVNAVTGAAF